MKIELDRVAIWQHIIIDKINIRAHPIGTTYIENGLAKTAHEPLYRFVKNYSRGDDLHYSLIVRTFNQDVAAVEKSLDEINDKLTVEEILISLSAASAQNFIYSDYYLQAQEEK